MARRIRKVIGVLLLITAFLVTQIPGYESNAASSADFQMDNDTLVKYVGTASSVSIPSNVKVIGAEAFAGNTTLTAVSVGKNVKEIKYGAFKDCTYLSKVSLPDSLETIGNSVFSNNTSLKKITLSKNIKNLGSGVFAGCENLKTISIDKDNPNFVFYKNGLYDKEKTKLYCYVEGAAAEKYTMPSTVEAIDEYAFWGNDVLEQITLSTKLKEISSYSFSNCKQLAAISIPYSVKSIDSKAFENCTSLKEVEIPASVSYIHSTAFDGCPNLEIKADSGTLASDFYENWKLLNQTDGAEDDQTGNTVVDQSGKVYVVGSDGKLVEVGKGDSKEEDEKSESANSALHDPSNVDYVPLNDPVKEFEEGVIGQTIIVGQNAVVMIDPQAEVYSQIENRSVSEEEEQEAVQAVVDEEKGDTLPKFAVVDNKIAAHAYYGDNGLTSYNIPNTINRIGDFAFARSGLKSITIPSSVREIGYAAFYHCNDLVEISIPNTVTWIEPSAFAYSGWLTNWAANTENDDFLIVGDNILLAYKGNSSYVEIPDGVETIAPACFMGHEEIEGISIPDSVTIIGEEAFQNCTSLKMIHGANNVKKIQDRAFQNTNLTSVTIYQHVEEIGVAAFDCEDKNTERTVTFKGNDLPVLSYTKSTSKIINNAVRPSAFNGNWTAIVNEKNIAMEGTILDDNGMGFVGKIVVADNKGGQEVIATNKKEETAGGSVTVQSEIPEWPADKVTVDFSQDGEYHLNIRISASEGILPAFKRIYGEKNIPPMLMFDMTLYDRTDSIAFTQFGNRTLTVTVPLPSNLKGNTVHVAALDEDGQLEKLSASIQQKDGKDYVQFSTTHLSKFVMYAMGEEGSVRIEDGEVEYTAVSGKKDYSPNTGDNSIHPKWFAAIGIVSLAIALMAYRPKRRKHR